MNLASSMRFKRSTKHRVDTGTNLDHRLGYGIWDHEDLQRLLELCGLFNTIVTDDGAILRDICISNPNGYIKG